MLDLIPIAAVRASLVLNYSWCGVRLDHRRREVGLTNDYPRLDESLSVLVERFPSLQPLAGAEFLNNGTLYPSSMKAANKARQDKKKATAILKIMRCPKIYLRSKKEGCVAKLLSAATIAHTLAL